MAGEALGKRWVLGGGQPNRQSELRSHLGGATHHSEWFVNVTFFSEGLHAVFLRRSNNAPARGREHCGDFVIDAQLFETTADMKAHRALGQAQNAGDVRCGLAHA